MSFADPHQGMKAYHTIKDVYRTDMATATVTIRPGTRPKTEYEYGKDMMAKQMYSEKSKAAVCWMLSDYSPACCLLPKRGIGEAKKSLRRVFVHSSKP